MLRKLIYTVLVIIIIALGGYLLSIKMDDWKASQIATAPPEKVTVHFAVAVPPETPRYQKLYLAGNAKALGAWRAEGLELKKATTIATTPPSNSPAVSPSSTKSHADHGTPSSAGPMAQRSTTAYSIPPRPKPSTLKSPRGSIKAKPSQVSPPPRVTSACTSASTPRS